MRKWVRKPRVQYDAVGLVATHGRQLPVRIVLHDTECCDAPGFTELAAVAKYWVNTGLGYGAHFVVDKAGNVAQCADPDRIMWAVENRNSGTVHIELIGFSTYGALWWKRPKQLAKVAKLIAWLNAEYGIPIEHDPDRGVSGHREQPKQTHTDPGRVFPYKLLLTLARRYRSIGWT